MASLSSFWLVLLFLGQDCMPTPALGSLLLASLSCSHLPHWNQGLGSANPLPQHQVGSEGQVAGSGLPSPPRAAQLCPGH